MTEMDRRQLMWLAAAGSMAGAGAAAAQQPTQDRPTGGARILRFEARLDATVGARDPDGHYRPVGQVFPAPGADPALGSAPAAYRSVVDSNVDGRGGFTDNVTIAFAGGDLLLKGVYPTRNEVTPIPDLRHTVMTERVLGGTGAFAGATGYLLLNCTLKSPGHIEGMFAGVVFLAG